ncbi:hypothetical protein H480_32203 [Amycolatopsis vancoresmycina DSM 44592]|uniref:Uncharacterized protein n=2 Tax=Amycolatopsis vancoresmycina TaxID=208444 RepID=R1FYI8_9PSEU|nr:hypothetical protein H480_32203 [Amycolatopsis vancoresmycina DSM 44592]
MGHQVDQLVKLLEARSRTSDALPSLRYVEDPRASLAAATATRHQIVYGRRGVGKTALLVESKRLAERDGHITAWINAQVLKGFSASEAFLFLAETILETIVRHVGSSIAPIVGELRERLQGVRLLRAGEEVSSRIVSGLVADINGDLRRVLRHDLHQLVVYIDDFYLYSAHLQAEFLDLVAALLRDCNGWIKLASIERLTRPYEPSTRVGLEVPHDATKIDLDVTLEDPKAAQSFLERVLSHYMASAGMGGVGAIANSESLGRLVLASGGVPRDYLNLFSNSIVVARERVKAREIGREDVAGAAGLSARSKKRDLELDVSSAESPTLLDSLERMSESIKGVGYTYFRVDFAQKMIPGYEVLSRLVDLRFAHLIQPALSDKHSPGTKYEAYVLALSEYTDVRLQRGLQVLDIEGGTWTHRQSGKAKTTIHLSGTQFRDRLRLAPVLDLEKLVNGGPRNVLLHDAYEHTNSRGEVFFLNSKVVTLRDKKTQRIYYFSKSLQPDYATGLPAGMTVRENPKNGFLTLIREGGE